MKVDFTGSFARLEDAGDSAAEAERRGYDGWWVTETKVDPPLACAVAAQRSERIAIGTAVTIAFARNPMTVALQANDLQALSGGRFSLGLGSQIKAHVTKRFSMPWGKPGSRMREFVRAIRAIWESWENGTPLAFEGEFYEHTLMTPFFDPGPNPYGNPDVYLAAVGSRMTEIAGEVGDGLICHAFSTERYVREVTVPLLEDGRRAAGRAGESFELVAPGFVVAADDPAELATGIASVKEQIGFYGSTPAYRPVLDLHGWGDLGDRLNRMSKRGEWEQMAEAIDDEVVDAFAVVGSPEEVVAELARRYGDVATRLTLQLPERPDMDRWAPLLAQLRGAGEQGKPTEEEQR
ncbi:MAG TPA: TIGR03617 family F420-dependent LLM class oxidoreductase [Solirubrobacterales bacterium]|nr:TIGR03617 family F420-dependent LLM class oxidoreductase [Solirubrobacterales bacterium]